MSVTWRHSRHVEVLFVGCGLLVCGHLRPKQTKPTAQSDLSQCLLFKPESSSCRCEVLQMFTLQKVLLKVCSLLPSPFPFLHLPPLSTELSAFVLAEGQWLCACLSGGLQGEANEVPRQSRAWLLIWPLQRTDRHTCRQLLTGEHTTEGQRYRSHCGGHFLIRDIVVEVPLRFSDKCKINQEPFASSLVLQADTNGSCSHFNVSLG